MLARLSRFTGVAFFVCCNLSGASGAEEAKAAAVTPVVPVTSKTPGVAGSAASTPTTPASTAPSSATSTAITPAPVTPKASATPAAAPNSPTPASATSTTPVPAAASTPTTLSPPAAASATAPFALPAAPALVVGKWLSGLPVSLQNGKRYVINFCATWVAPCKPIFPYISALSARHKDVTFLAISTLENKSVEAYYKNLAPVITYSVGLDKNNQSADLWLQPSTNLPYSCIIDNGLIVWSGSPFEGLEPALLELAAKKFNAKKAAGDAGRFSSFMQNLQGVMEGGDPDAIVTAVEDGLKNFPQYASVLEPLRFEILLQRKQDFSAAFALAAELAAGVLKENAGDLQRLARTLLEGDDEEGLELALKLVRQADGLYQSTDAQCLALQAEILFAQGDTATAVETQKLAVAHALDKREGILLKRTLRRYNTRLSEELQAVPAAAESGE